METTQLSVWMFTELTPLPPLGIPVPHFQNEETCESGKIHSFHTSAKVLCETLPRRAWGRAAAKGPPKPGGRLPSPVLCLCPGPPLCSQGHLHLGGTKVSPSHPASPQLSTLPCCEIWELWGPSPPMQNPLPPSTVQDARGDSERVATGPKKQNAPGRG